MRADCKEEQCSHINRVSVHPSIRIGGPSIGRCEGKCVPGMVVCYEHATKDSLAYLVRSLTTEVARLKKANGRKSK